MKTGAVIAAAGMSSRMGSFKPLLEIGPTTMVKRIIAAFKQAGAAPIVVVTGHKAEELTDHLSGEGVAFVHNAYYETTQMLDSARIGLKYIMDKCDRTFFTTVDIPLFSENTLLELLKSDAVLTKPRCGGVEGHPILLNCELIPEILCYNGDAGLRAALDMHTCGTHFVELPDEGILLDADTPEDYERLVALHGGSRTIYLIRHGSTDSSGRCISRTDYPLDAAGIEQAAFLRDWARNLAISTLFTSPLKRCVQTAEIMASSRFPIQVEEDLREMDVGEWENLTFDEIRSRYPEDYAARGEHPGTIPPTGGENFSDAGARLLDCLERIMARTPGDAAVVTHSGVIRGALCRLMGMSPDYVLAVSQPFGCVSILQHSGAGGFALLSAGGIVSEALAHGKAVAELAERFASRITDIHIDRALLRAACLLHDMFRGVSGHAEKAGAYLRKRGYRALAEIVESHHDLPNDACIEAELLYLSDKLVLGSQRVLLNERFEQSAHKCKDSEAKAAWKRRYDSARRIAEQYKLNVEE